MREPEARKTISCCLNFILFFVCYLLFCSIFPVFGQPLSSPIDISEASILPELIIEKKGLDRWPDPIIIKGDMFPELLGKKISNMRILSCRQGKLEIIPFQIDERDENGQFILPGGKFANPEDGNGLLDQQDEIVFMARDTGDRVDPAAWRKGSAREYEITLKDPIDKSKGWCYLLFYQEDPPPLSPQDYIHYRPDEKGPYEGPDKKFCSAWSDYFNLGFCVMSPYFDKSDFPDECGLAHHLNSPGKAAGYDEGADFRDRFKVRVKVKILFGLLKIKYNESQMVYYEEAYTDGPVRTIFLFQVKPMLPFGIEGPGTRSQLIFYDTHALLPLTIRIPLNPGRLFHSIQLALCQDHSPDAWGMMAYNSNNPEGMLVDGTMSPQEELWNTDRDTWRLATGPQGTQLGRSFWDPDYLRQMYSVACMYMDDVKNQDPPEDHPGQVGSVWQTNEIRNIARGEYFSHLHWCWIPRFFFSGEGSVYRPGDEKPYLDIMDNLVQIMVEKKQQDNSLFDRKIEYSSQKAESTEVQSTIPK